MYNSGNGRPYSVTQSVAEFSPTIAQGKSKPFEGCMEFESSEGDQKEKLLKVFKYEKAR